MRISLTSNALEVIARLDSFGQKQVPFATMLTLNAMVKQIREDEMSEMTDIFSSPTPYTLRSVKYTRVKKGEMSAEVYIENHPGKGVAATKFLRAQIEGGGRSLKRFELALRSVGVLPSGYYAVPGEAAQIDAWGNMSRGQIVQILSYFKAFPEIGYKANMTDKRRESLKRGSAKRYGIVYFSVQHGDTNHRRRGLHPGVWMRQISGLGSRVRPVLIFVSRASYEPIFDFEYVAKQSIRRHMDVIWKRSLESAMRTAR